MLWKVNLDVWTNVLEEVELVQTTENSYGFSADKINAVSSTGSDVKASKSFDPYSNHIN